MTREELIRMPEYHIAQASDAYWKKNKDIEEANIMSAFEDGADWMRENLDILWKQCSIELPPEICHYDYYWASNDVLTRKKIKTPDGIEKYVYHVCVYLYDEKRWMILDNQMQFYEPDEWIELNLYP